MVSGSTFPIFMAARITMRASPVATPKTSSAIRWRASAPIRPTIPQSMKVIRPSSWTKMLPGCGSAWKKPSSRVCRNTARAPLAMIFCRISSGSDWYGVRARRRPFTRSIVSTPGVVASQ